MRGDQSGHLRGSPLHHAVHFSPCTFVCLILPSPPTSCLLISPSLSVSISLAILCFLPILPSSPLFPVSLSPSSLPSPISVSLLLHPPRPFARWRGGEDHPPITAQLLQHLQPQRLKERELGFRGHIWGSPAGITASPQHPTGLSLLPSAFCMGDSGLYSREHHSDPRFPGHLSIAWGGHPFIPPAKCLCSVFIS